MQNFIASEVDVYLYTSNSDQNVTTMVQVYLMSQSWDKEAEHYHAQYN